GSAWRPATRHRRDGGAPRPEAAGGRCAKRSWRSHLARVCAPRTALPACRARLALRIPTDPHAGSVAHEPAFGADEFRRTRAGAGTGPRGGTQVAAGHADRFG